MPGCSQEYGFPVVPVLGKDDVVDAHRCYVIHRRGGLIGLSLQGEIDDRLSTVWRSALEREVVRAGFAEYYAVDGSEMIVRTSLGASLRSALFVRNLMVHARHAAVYARGVRNPTLAMRALLTTAGVGNVKLCADPALFASVVEQMLRGELA